MIDQKLHLMLIYLLQPKRKKQQFCDVAASTDYAPDVGGSDYLVEVIKIVIVLNIVEYNHYDHR